MWTSDKDQRVSTLDVRESCLCKRIGVWMRGFCGFVADDVRTDWEPTQHTKLIHSYPFTMYRLMSSVYRSVRASVRSRVSVLPCMHERRVASLCYAYAQMSHDRGQVRNPRVSERAAMCGTGSVSIRPDSCGLHHGAWLLCCCCCCCCFSPRRAQSSFSLLLILVASHCLVRLRSMLSVYTAPTSTLAMATKTNLRVF